MRDWTDVLSKINSIEQQILDNKKGNVNIKYQIIALFKHVKEAIGYRIEKHPIDISEDKTGFRCPTCKTYMKVEDCTYEAFEFCPLCGQRLRKKGSREEHIDIYG